MRIKNRLSPYPILDDYGDDYIDSSFKVEYQVDPQFSEVYGKLSFKLNNQDILNLINDQTACYSVHIECPVTCYREVLTSYDEELEFKIPAEAVSQLLEIRTFIVLTEDIDGFKSEKFHPDYSDTAFDLKKHQILAIGTAKNYTLQKDDRDLESFPSIIQIHKMNDKKNGTIKVNTDNDDYILIGLDENVYYQYAQLGKSTFRYTALSLVLLPAMMVVIERMHNNRNDPDMTGRHWYKVIDSLLVKNGFDIDNISIENDTLLKICQALFADPVARSFKELETCSERM